MLLRVPAILYGKLGAAVQTAEAHHAFVLDPDGLACLHFDGLHRAFLCAQSAAYAALLYVKMRRPPCAPVSSTDEVSTGSFITSANICVHTLDFAAPPTRRILLGFLSMQFLSLS